MGYNILSLFDGMSCGQIALNKLGIEYDNYYASEIDQFAKLVTQKHYPNTIQLNDVRGVHGHSFREKIDFLLAGSPCQDLSRSSHGLGLNGSKSKLFWEFIRLLKETNPTYFLLENVPMLDIWKNMITNEISKIRTDFKLTKINSNLVSAQNRERLYWTNIPIDPLQNKYLSFKDIINNNANHKFLKQDNRITRSKWITKKGTYVQWDLNDTGWKSQGHRAYFPNGKICTLSTTCAGLNICLDYDNDVYRKLNIIEAERLQTVPDNYTDVVGVPINERFKMLGNGWTVSVISHILSGLK